MSAAAFSALNALVLRPAPIKDPGRLIGAWPINALGQHMTTLAPVADLLQDGPARECVRVQQQFCRRGGKRDSGLCRR